MLALNLREDWFVQRGHNRIYDSVLVSRVTLHVDYPKRYRLTRSDEVQVSTEIMEPSFYLGSYKSIVGKELVD
jgi:hypothetical protein